MENTGIHRAVERFGSAGKLAAAVGHGVIRQNVEHWLKAGRVSPEKAPEVAVTTGIPLEDLNDRVNWNLARRCPPATPPADGGQEQAHA